MGGGGSGGVGYKGGVSVHLHGDGGGRSEVGEGWGGTGLGGGAACGVSRESSFSLGLLREGTATRGFNTLKSSSSTSLWDSLICLCTSTIDNPLNPFYNSA